MSTATDSIIKELEEQKKKEGSLPELLEFYLKSLHIQSRVGQRIDAPSPSFSGNFISERTEQGKPLPLICFADY